MSKKNIIIISVIGLMVLTGATLLIFRKPHKTPDEVKGDLIKNAEPSESGQEVVIVEESEEEGLYGNPRFEIQYQEPFDLFLISILARPVEEVRKEAEQALLEKTGGELEALCQLNVMISAPNFITEGEPILNPEKLNICLK